MNTAGLSLSTRQHSRSHDRLVLGTLGAPYHCLPVLYTYNGYHVLDQDKRRLNRSWNSSWQFLSVMGYPSIFISRIKHQCLK